MNDPAAMARLCEDLAAKAAQDPGLPVSNPTASYWQIVPHELAYHQSTTLPSRVDVAIIGSGMTGISTAYHLLQEQPRLRVTVLEARSLTSGATGRNGGHCKEVPYVDYAGLKTKYGTEAAKKIVRFRLAQLDAMLETAKDLGPKLLDASELRCVDSLDVYYDREVFDRMKLRLADYLADFPEQRDRWLAYEGEDLDDVRLAFGFPSRCDVPSD
jgi:choline dehydrogenase-like flavoprotein